MWEQYGDTIITVGSILLSVGLGLVAKSYAAKYGKLVELIKDLAAAVEDGKLTKEELEELVQDVKDVAAPEA